ncbi:MAG: HigA family addiction module antitoxin [Patescibacteria group bacterium]
MVDTTLSYNPDIAIHPGETLNDEIGFLNLTQVDLAKRTGLSEKHISQIINGQDPISPDTAIKLERALGTSAEFWNNLQKNYELNCARISAEQKMATEIEEAKKFICYSELVSIGYIEKAKDWKNKAENLLKFFGVDSLLYIKRTEEIAFRQTPGKFDQLSLAAWLRCGEIKANTIKTEAFDKKKVREIIPEARKLTLHPDFGKKLQDLCASAGIAVIYTPYLKNTKVSGSARWLGDKAVIQLNTKGSYSDIFWFTFFHELGHILLHGVKERFIDYKGKLINEKEQEANDFAADTLIPTSEYKVFLKNRPLTKQAVKTFAESISVDPGIVLGRLGHDNIAQWRQIAGARGRLTITP